jgi:drug/metabolite transporter (DMT)-like permease
VTASSGRAAVALPFAVVTLIWGSTWIVIRDQAGAVPPSWSVAYRFLLAGGAMALLGLWRHGSLRVDRRAMLFVGGVALSQFCLNFNFVYRAEHHLTSGLVALLYALLIIPNSLLAWLLYGQRISARFAVGSLIACAGVALLFLREWRASPPGSGDAVILGLALGAAGVLSASASNVMQSSGAARRVPMEVSLAWAMLIGAALDALLALSLTGPPPLETRAGYWAGVAYLALVGSVATFPLYFRLIQRIGPGPAAYTNVLVPIVAMTISTGVEGYRWTPLAVWGGLLAIGGMVLALRGRR